jgi:Ca2+-binding EF-hand superfamily protein
LKFEKLSSVLKDVKAVFRELSVGYPNGLTLQGLQEAMTSLEVEMTKDEIADLFGFIDLDGSLKIELKEFLVALTIGMVLDKIPAFQQLDPVLSPRTPHVPSNGLSSPVSITLQNKTTQIRDMLSLIISAYLLFDPEGEGLIRKSSVEKILEEIGHQSGRATFLSSQKWKEMVSSAPSLCSHPCLTNYVTGLGSQWHD